MLRVPVRRIVNGEKERFPLPACEEIEVNLVNAFRRRKMEYTIGVEDDSLLEVRVQSSEMALGAYALEVKGKLFGCSWRSNEYEQLQLVDNNASGDTEFGETDEGEDSVEMDTALVVLAPVTVIDGNFEVLKNEIANGVRDGKWLPLKRGRKSDGTFVGDSVEMGYQSEATGYGSTAMGYNCKASGNTAHAENTGCKATGDNSHAEGINTLASGNNSHAEGEDVQATGDASHAEGFLSRATAPHAHAEGFDSEAGGEKSHAEGYQTVTSAVGSHAEGFQAQAKNAYSHAEGNATIADGQSSHAEGVASYASHEGAHAEGNSIASGLLSHSENKGTASGAFSHAEGNSRASGDYSHAEGSGCKTEDELKVGSYCHVEGIGTICISKGGHTEGGNTVVAGNFAHAEGVSSRADGTASHAEGKNTIANGDSAHAQGRFNVGNKYYIHSTGIGNENERKNAEYIYVNTDNAADPRNGYIYIYGIGGYDGIYADNTKYKSLQEVITSIEIANANSATKTDLEKNAVWTKGSGKYSIVAIGDGFMIHPTASGTGAVAEGHGTASGDCSHAEGQGTASGDYSHAEGNNCTASGFYSHAEGTYTEATGSASHAEGENCIASGFYSHAEGVYTKARGFCAHAEGHYCTVSGYYSHAQGSYNYDDKSFIDMVGVGDYTEQEKIRKNASVIYVGHDSAGNINTSDPKNGYQYLLDVGGYKGQEIGNAKSVQEVFADLTSRIEALEAKLADTTAEENQQTN